MLSDRRPSPAPPRASLFGRELQLRVASALVLGLLAIGAAYWGGWPFALFWMLAGLGVLWEWGHFVSPAAARLLTLVGAAGVAAAAFVVALGRPFDTVFVGAAALAGAAAAGRGLWGPAGILYAGSIVVAPLLLRFDPAWGLAAIVLLFAVVWGTDIAAYFGGRLLGGPKLWARVSPKKTWSGAIVGAAAAVLFGLIVAAGAGVRNLLPIGLLCVVLSIASQLGDLLESAIKRRFSAKDASHLIPGHGGVMDRLDGFVVAAVLALAIGILRGGLETPSRGLLIW